MLTALKILSHNHDFIDFFPGDISLKSASEKTFAVILAAQTENFAKFCEFAIIPSVGSNHPVVSLV